MAVPLVHAAHHAERGAPLMHQGHQCGGTHQCTWSDASSSAASVPVAEASCSAARAHVGPEHSDARDAALRMLLHLQPREAALRIACDTGARGTLSKAQFWTLLDSHLLQNLVQLRSRCEYPAACSWWQQYSQRLEVASSSWASCGAPALHSAPLLLIQLVQLHGAHSRVPEPCCTGTFSTR
jgi:hypothetical protein